MRSLFLLLTFCLPLSIVSLGCASGAQLENMVPDPLKVTHQHPFKVNVRTSGGQETNPMWSSQISDSAFAGAIRKAIQKHGIFQEVTEAQPDLQLEIKLIQLQQPLFGFDMTVQLHSEWSLSSADASQLLWKKSLNSTHTATVGDAFVAVTRLRLANEGAGKNNIQEGLEALSALEIPESAVRP